MKSAYRARLNFDGNLTIRSVITCSQRERERKLFISLLNANKIYPLIAAFNSYKSRVFDMETVRHKFFFVYKNVIHDSFTTFCI